MIHAFTVVASHPSATSQLADLPENVRLRIWDGTGAFPGDDDIEIWVPPFSPTDIVGIAAATPSLRVIQLPTSGADQVPPGLRRDVVVHSARGVHDAAVSEWVLAAILAANRELPAHARAQAEGAPRRLIGRGLDGNRVTLVGYGSIAQAVEHRLSGFDIAITRVARSAREGVLSIDDLSPVLTRTDVLVLFVPFTPQTGGIIHAGHLEALPDGALVVNVARGEIIDQTALFAEVASGRLRAALDVAVPDPLREGDPALALPGLFYTPHVAGVTYDAFCRVNAFLREQIERYVLGESLLNRLEPSIKTL
jgi:phosphoglycerate dehydrogenase-like enzyme